MCKVNDQECMVQWAKNLKQYTYQKDYEEVLNGKTMYMGKVLVPMSMIVNGNWIDIVNYKLYLAQYSNAKRNLLTNLYDTGVMYGLETMEPDFYPITPIVPHDIQYYFPDYCYSCDIEDVIVL